MSVEERVYDVKKMKTDIQTIINLISMSDFKNMKIYNKDDDIVKKYNERGKQFLITLVRDSVLQIRVLKNNEFSSCFSANHQPEGGSSTSYYQGYVWAKNIWNEKSFSVAVSVDPDVNNDICFYAKLDITDDASDEYKERIGNGLNDLKDKIEKSTNITGLSIKQKINYFDKSGGQYPKIIIPLENRTDYQALVNELTLDIVLLKAMYRYVCTTNDEERKKVFRKLESLMILVDKIVTNEYNPGPTFFKIQDLIFDDCKQIVLTGAPGTGKSYSAKEYVKWCLWCKKENKTLTKDEYEAKWKDTESEVNKNWTMVQFHPSYDYTDFVEGLRPISIKSQIKSKNGKNEIKTTFVRIDGEFKRFCRWVAKKNKDSSDNIYNNYYFIIDEINRADLSKVFGELMYCLEEGYRGSSHRIKTQYSNLDTYESNGDPVTNDEFKPGFYIPENVIIIGTMNDIDRGVDTFDFALRRRFRWVNIEVNNQLLMSTFYSMKNKYNSDIEDSTMCDYINSILNMNSVLGDQDAEWRRMFRPARDYFVGPAYFEGIFKSGESINNIWSNKIEPLLREYVRGQEFAEDFISACFMAIDTPIIIFKEEKYRDLVNLLKDFEGVDISKTITFYENCDNQIEDNFTIEKVMENATKSKKQANKSKLEEELKPLLELFFENSDTKESTTASEESTTAPEENTIALEERTKSARQ